MQKKKKEEPSSLFQRRRVDMLLDHLTRQFPFRVSTAKQDKVSKVRS